MPEQLWIRIWWNLLNRSSDVDCSSCCLSMRDPKSQLECLNEEKLRLLVQVAGSTHSYMRGLFAMLVDTRARMGWWRGDFVVYDDYQKGISLRIVMMGMLYLGFWTDPRSYSAGKKNLLESSWRSKISSRYITDLYTRVCIWKVYKGVSFYIAVFDVHTFSFCYLVTIFIVYIIKLHFSSIHVYNFKEKGGC